MVERSAMFLRIKKKEIPPDEGRKRIAGIESLLEELARDYDGGWVTLQGEGSDAVIEVACEASHFILNIPHQEPHGLLPKLREAEFEIPALWAVKKDKRKAFFPAGTVISLKAAVLEGLPHPFVAGCSPRAYCQRAAGEQRRGPPGLPGLCNTHRPTQSHELHAARAVCRRDHRPGLG